MDHALTFRRRRRTQLWPVIGRLVRFASENLHRHCDVHQDVLYRHGHTPESGTGPETARTPHP
jgi:hypothetical protein